ncbi:hypothetical protein TI05_13015 [Achromatium sp. WMS3]|nr:hypothetical protein TI05_13015 [Achromatium sp. WMS3]
MAKHPNKHIQKAVEYAETHGWRLIKAGGHTHVWGKLLCPLKSRNGCFFNIHSTPQNPELHAVRIQRVVDNCNH